MALANPEALAISSRLVPLALPFRTGSMVPVSDAETLETSAAPMSAAGSAWRRFGALPWWRLVAAGLLINGAMLALSVPYQSLRLLQPPASEEARSAVRLALQLTALESAQRVAAALDLENDGEPLAQSLQRMIDRTQRDMRQQALLEELFDHGELALLEAERRELNRPFCSTRWRTFKPCRRSIRRKPAPCAPKGGSELDRRTACNARR